MNRRDRILACIEHKPVDKVPISLDISGDAKQKVLQYFGVRELCDLYAKSGIEGFSVWDWPSAQPAYVGKPREGVTEYDRSMAYGCWGKVGEHVYPLKDLSSYEFPKVQDFDFSHLKQDLLNIKQQDMTAASGHAGCGWLHHVQMRSYDNIFYDVIDQDFMDEYLARNKEFFVAYFTALFKAADGNIDIIRADEDVGGQQSMMISPEMWRKLYKPIWKAVFDICKSNGAKIWLHSCGYCYPIVNDFIELGVDILNPIPPYVKDSETQKMKDEFGSKLAFDGGIDQMNVIARGTPKDVRREVKKTLEIFKDSSGYIIGPSQVFMPSNPIENILEFFKTALEYGVK